VVLVILGLVSGLLLQGLSYTMILREKLQVQVGKVQVSQLQESWFRKSCEGFILPQIEEYSAKLAFKGTELEFSGKTLFPLDAPTGVITNIFWRLEQNESYFILQYKGADNKWWDVANWLTEQANFIYLDANNHWHGQWPTDEFPNQLPEGIALIVELEEKELVWYSRLLGDKKAPVNPILDY